MSDAAAALVEAAFRGLAAAPRQSVAAAVASLIRVVLGQSIANASTLAEEVVMRLEHITPVLAHKVAAGATADGAQASGNRRAARNVAEHVGLGEGTASLEKALLNPQRSQRGRRRPRVPGHQEPQTDTLGGDKIQHIAVASPKLTPLLRRQAARDWTHLRLQEVAPAVKETEGMTEGDNTTPSSLVEDSDHKPKDMHKNDDSDYILPFKSDTEQSEPYATTDTEGDFADTEVGVCAEERPACSDTEGNEAKENVPAVPAQEEVAVLTTALRNGPRYGHVGISVLEDMARSFLIQALELPDEL